MKVLNLFGYTGAISMACAAAGAKVTHLDASKKAVAWAKENQELCRVPGDRIRWILDDALKFVQREARRGSFYDGVILDPPKFGRGPKGEVWEFYKGFPPLLEACAAILSDHADFMLVTAYAVKASSVTLHNALCEAARKKGGIVSAGEVCHRDRADRLLSMAVYGRWMKDAGKDIP
jgi:23S rRNA (cytosine1962-C5)-methyltransferase